MAERAAAVRRGATTIAERMRELVTARSTKRLLQEPPFRPRERRHRGDRRLKSHLAGFATSARPTSRIGKKIEFLLQRWPEVNTVASKSSTSG